MQNVILKFRYLNSGLKSKSKVDAMWIHHHPSNILMEHHSIKVKITLVQHLGRWNLLSHYKKNYIILTYQKKFNRKYTLVCVCTYTGVISKMLYYSYISLKQVLIHNYIHDRLDFFLCTKNWLFISLVTQSPTKSKLVKLLS